MTKRIDTALFDAVKQLTQSESAKLDAELLLGFVLGRSRTYLFTWPEKQLTQDELAQFDALIAKRVLGHPVAHLIGEREFWGLSLEVSPATLIPRPDTELLVEFALSRLENITSPKVLDLGTGTGAIALAIASERADANVLGVDFSEGAVALAKRNQSKLALHNASFVKSNWFSAVSGLYDLIVSNPPYIDEDDPHLTQGDVRFEPASALVAPSQGLADIEHIASLAAQYLNDGGILAVEHGYQQAQAVQEVFLRYDWKQVNTLKDLGNNERVTYGVKG